MRKFIAVAALGVLLCPLAACTKNVDYTAYISEKRTNLYLYADDTTDIKIYCSQREQPYAADGYCGERCDIVEVFAAFAKTPDEVTVSLEGHEGEMSYEAVENRFFFSFTAEEFSGDSVEITLAYGGDSATYTALGARSAGVMSCEEALQCVIEYDGALFEGLTRNGLFEGEIFVRLLYDDGCYYYVGVCNKDKKISAYLLDGERGKVIATKQLQG